MSPSWVMAMLQRILIYLGLYGIPNVFDKDGKNISVLVTRPPSIPVSRVIHDIEKFSRDNMDYRGLEMGNKMKVLLISDTTTNKSAASLCVAAGSMQDPKRLPGLAHFCEHMLFLGTDFSNEVNEYFQFLSEHSGYSNAYTAKDHTCYYFDVAAESFPAALLRFSRFFIAPSFTKEMTEREVNAVNSEHEKNIANDDWRIYAIELLLADQKHTYSQFATGNRDTLWNIPHENSVDVRDALVQYYESYYSANLMNLVVLGKENLNQLQKMVETLFHPVKNYQYKLPTWTQNPYGPDQLQYRANVISVEDIRMLQLIFPVPDTSSDYKSYSGGYLSHLIGHEGSGSLLSLLKNQSLCNSLSAGYNVLSRGNAAFQISMELTVDGFNSINNIICHLFQYLNMLRKFKPQAWIWKEIVELGKIGFQNQEKLSPIKLTSRLSPHLHELKMQHILSGGIYAAEFKPQQISKILEKLKPENCIVIVAAQEIKNQNAKNLFVEHYYGIKYSKTKLDPQLIKEWQNCSTHDDLKLPIPNPYIPKNFKLKPRDVKQRAIFPRLLKDAPLMRVWYFQDNEFKIPKGQITIDLFSVLPGLDPHHINLNCMLARAIWDCLTEELYPPKLAGLQLKIETTNNGLEILLTGFNDKIMLLLGKVLRVINDFNLNEKRFGILKDKYIRDLKNWDHTQPYLQAKFYVDYVLQKRQFLHSEYIEAAEAENKLTLANLIEYVKKFLANLKLDMLICGNFSEEDSLNLIKTVEDFFNGTSSIPTSNITPNVEVKLPKDVSYVLTTTHKSSATSVALVYFQAGNLSATENISLQLIASFVREPVFTQLRTNEQLGYIAATQLRTSYGTEGILIFVQGNYHPSHVDYRIHVFLQEFGVSLKKMKEEQFQRHVESLRVQLAEKPKTIRERAMLIWGEIKSQYYDFNRQENALLVLKTLKKSDIINFYEKYILVGGKERRRLAIHVKSNSSETKQPLTPDVSAHTKSSMKLELTNITSWKAECEFYPPVDPTEVLSKFKL